MIESTCEYLRQRIEQHLKPTNGEEMITLFPVWEDGCRAMVFAVTPAGGETPGVRMRNVISRLFSDGECAISADTPE